MVAGGLLLAAVTAFTPAQLVSGAAPGLPGPHVVAGGEVLIEVTIDTRGAVTRSTVLRCTPPFTNMLLEAIQHWRFTPARGPDRDGRDRPVESRVLVGAVYRQPALVNGPTLGTRPADVARASADAPYPVTTAVPVQPPQAHSAGVVLLEVSLDQTGATKGLRRVDGDPSFEAAASDAVRQWQFRGATSDGRGVPSLAYVVVVFPLPVVVVAKPAPAQ